MSTLDTFKWMLDRRIHSIEPSEEGDSFESLIIRFDDGTSAVISASNIGSGCAVLEAEVRGRYPDPDYS